ncbi:TPA: hypothetical protein RMM45_004236 [Escherichia coli]|nr:hypothetical protein [Escherichia coli]
MGYLVLLGAGASYGSEHVHPYPPPLGNQLFNRLVESGHTAAKLPDELKCIFTDNFEKGMNKLCKDYPLYIMSFQRELAGYLAKFTPIKGNHYYRLLNILRHNRITYSSLNYDLLFELAAFHAGFNTIYSLERKNQHINLLKIHGSSNFWPAIQRSMFVNCQIYNSNPDGEDISAPITAVDQKEALHRSCHETSMSPAIAIFAEGKKVRVGARYVEKQLRMWQECVMKSSKIFIIGVMVHQIDKHIWDVLGCSKADIHYFGLCSDVENFNQWKHTHNKTNCYFHLAKFSESIDIIKRHTK